MSLRNSTDSTETRAQESTKTPNNGGSGGSSQGAERSNEALMIIRSLKQEEKGINAVIITVAVPPIPYAPDPALASSGLGLLWANVYWTTSLVFGLSAIFIAVLIKEKIRVYRVVIQRRGRPPLEAQIPGSLGGDAGAWYMFEETDTMYRLLQVSLIVLPLGHASTLYPLGATIFIPTVVSGLLYVFGAIGPTVGPEQPPLSPSSG